MTKRTAGALAYLLTSLVCGVIGFASSLTATLAIGILWITQLGPPLFLGATWIFRHFAELERRRARWVSGSTIASPYIPIDAATVWGRVRQIATQPATWRDVVWLLVLLPLGLIGGVAAIVVTAIDLAAITAPIWAWAVPNPNAPALPRAVMTTPPGRIALTAVGVALLPAASWLLRTLARAQVAAANALLAPGEHRRLVERAARLAETRARVVDSQAAELRRIERDLHDGAQARIVATGMILALAARKLRSGAAATDEVQQARRQLDNALADLRRLVRGIHPPILTDRGLHEALLALAGDSPLDVELRAATTGRLPPAVESAAYYLVTEALANAAKHAVATACVVEVSRTVHDTVTVAVTDNGHGGADPGGRGLDGLRQRIEALDGSFALTSPPGGPTTVQAELPCAS